MRTQRRFPHSFATMCVCFLNDAVDWSFGDEGKLSGWDARAHAHFAFLILNKFVNK